jgi:hypothetical protein
MERNRGGALQRRCKEEDKAIREMTDLKKKTLGFDPYCQSME